MKNLILPVFLLFGGALCAQIQPTAFSNSNVNFIVFLSQVWSNADGDGGLNGYDDIVMHLGLHVNGSPSGAPDDQCIYWQGDAPCTNNAGNILGALGNIPYNSHMQMFLLGYESDNSDVCTYYDGSDDLPLDIDVPLNFDGAVVSFGELQAVPDVYLGYGPNEWVMNLTQLYDLRGVKYWRYTAGDDINDPLHFADQLQLNTAGLGYRTNSNPQPGGLNVPVGWSDNGGEPSPDIFYSFTVDNDAQVTVSTEDPSTNFDTYLTLYDANNNQIDSDDDSGANLSSIITATLPAGTYKIRVEGAGTNFGQFYLQISGVPLGSAACSAIPVQANGQVIVGSAFNNTNATPALGENVIIPPFDCNTSWCDATIDHPVWAKFVAPASGAVEVNTCDQSDFDTQLALYSVGNCSNFNTYTLVKANDDFCGLSSTLAAYGLNPGQNYYILVDGYLGQTGNFSLRITPLQPSAVQNVTASSGILTAFPNPTDGPLNVRMDNSDQMTACTIQDIRGRNLQVFRPEHPVSATDLDLNTLAPGVYILKVEAGDRTYSQKIVKI